MFSEYYLQIDSYIIQQSSSLQYAIKIYTATYVNKLFIQNSCNNNNNVYNIYYVDDGNN